MKTLTTILLIGTMPLLALEAPPKQSVLPSAYWISWSLNGERCLVKRGLDRYEIFDAAGNPLWSRTMIAHSVVFAPDGNSIAYVVPSNGLYVTTIQPEHDRKIANLQGTQNLITQLCWSPNGQKLAYWLFPGNELTKSPGELRFVNADGSN